MNKEFIQNLLLEEPLSLLGGHKIAIILDFLSDHKIENFLEIGTWVGGTVHLLNKACPRIHFSTLDINDFQKMHETNPTLVEVLKVKTGCAISPEEIKRLQYFYRNHSPDITFHDLQDFSWKDKIYDAVLIDGDHTIEGLTTDLENSFKHISHNGILFIDDFAYDHLRNVTESFCRQYDQKLIYTSDIEGEDLAVIQANKK